MSTDRLRVYNEALRIVGERKVSSLTENRQPRYLLDDAWDNNAVQHCLEKGLWIFATRGSKFTYDPNFTPDWGYRRVYTKPSDWIETVAMGADEYFRVPLLRYVDEGGFWFCDLDNIYVKYVSNDTSFGLNLSLWPSAFADYVSAHLATNIAPSLIGDEKRRQEVYDWEKRQLLNARSRDAQAKPTVFPAEGSWSRARRGFYNGRDQGSRGQLIG